ncbi:MAG: hypothetical protein A2571_01800 [Candidatus Vogelbacteria bacterium RIFOXYD1_FULL_44_32]|uniref:HTH merR-type domain-containing protein n=1 Tax=Candidatus Vogelbacteria bacterium RIFOXYD1_FULL_44_32 TaxID=1802438 RepID=A0A1G2QET3_9BACT|nr:MAG: hypothetical protein A2571_01800 [Candidatus Vogelbacteria bacterium RIFOXYD1_FULL_44_32]
MKTSANKSQNTRHPQYLSVKEVAELLNKCSSTIRAWDKNGVLKARRQPNTNYRLYEASAVAQLAATLGQTKKSKRELLP